MEAQLESYLQEAKARQLSELQEWLRIPSISTLSAHKKDVRRAAEWLADNMRNAGLENIQIIDSDTQPMVYADWLHAGSDKPTVLIYGHFDVQPVDPLNLWHTPPFEPAVRGADLVATCTTGAAFVLKFIVLAALSFFIAMGYGELAVAASAASAA